MDNAMNALFSWQFLLFCLMISGIMYIIRIIIEYFCPKLMTKTFWNELVLPLLPLGIGVMIAYFATGYAYPDGLNNLSGREAFGLVAGLLSTLVYRVVNALLKARIEGVIAQAGGSEITCNPPQNPPSQMGGPGPSVSGK